MKQQSKRQRKKFRASNCMGAKEILAERCGSGEWKLSQVRKSYPPLSKPHTHVSSVTGLLRTWGSRVQTAPTPLCHPSQACPSHVAGMFGYCNAEQPPMHLFALRRNQSISHKVAYSDKHLLVIIIFPNCF